MKSVSLQCITEPKLGGFKKDFEKFLLGLPEYKIENNKEIKSLTFALTKELPDVCNQLHYKIKNKYNTKVRRIIITTLLLRF